MWKKLRSPSNRRDADDGGADPKPKASKGSDEPENPKDEADSKDTERRGDCDDALINGAENINWLARGKIVGAISVTLIGIVLGGWTQLHVFVKTIEHENKVLAEKYTNSMDRLDKTVQATLESQDVLRKLYTQWNADLNDNLKSAKGKSERETFNFFLRELLRVAHSSNLQLFDRLMGLLNEVNNPHYGFTSYPDRELLDFVYNFIANLLKVERALEFTELDNDPTWLNKYGISPALEERHYYSAIKIELDHYSLFKPETLEARQSLRTMEDLLEQYQKRFVNRNSDHVEASTNGVPKWKLANADFPEALLRQNAKHQDKLRYEKERCQTYYFYLKGITEFRLHRWQDALHFLDLARSADPAIREPGWTDAVFFPIYMQHTLVCEANIDLASDDVLNSQNRYLFRLINEDFDQALIFFKRYPEKVSRASQIAFFQFPLEWAVFHLSSDKKEPDFMPENVIHQIERDFDAAFREMNIKQQTNLTMLLRVRLASPICYQSIREGYSDLFNVQFDRTHLTTNYMCAHISADYSKRTLKDLIDKNVMGPQFDDYIALQLRVLKLIVDAKKSNMKNADWDKDISPKLTEASELIKTAPNLKSGFPAAYMVRFRYDIENILRTKKFPSSR